jgi:DNA-directed RNA polymerase subunit RPC12/RpoP
MPFKCFPCGLSFDTVEEFAAHKRAHQEQPGRQPGKGPVCLKCGKPILLDSSKRDYRGDIPCPNCGQTMRVIIQDGEVVLAVSKAD